MPFGIQKRFCRNVPFSDSGGQPVYQNVKSKKKKMLRVVVFEYWSYGSYGLPPLYNNLLCFLNYAYESIHNKKYFNKNQSIVS